MSTYHTQNTTRWGAAECKRETGRQMDLPKERTIEVWLPMKWTESSASESEYVCGTSSPTNSFLDALSSFPNQNMWDPMYLDEDGEWILHALLNGTFVIAHDGSYQPEIKRNMYSAAVWVWCRARKKQMIVYFAEKSPHASSYGSEILGTIALQLILRAATYTTQSQYWEVPNVLQ